MQTNIDPRSLIGRKAYDRSGIKIGTVDEVYLDDATGRPEWAAVRTGLFGRDALVPLSAGELRDGALQVPFDKSLVKGAPDVGAGRHLSPAQEMRLYRHYGIAVPGAGPEDRTARATPARAGAAGSPAGPEPGRAEGSAAAAGDLGKVAGAGDTAG